MPTITEYSTDVEAANIYFKRGEYKKALEVSSRGWGIEERVIKAKSLMALGEYYDALIDLRAIREYFNGENNMQSQNWAIVNIGICHFDMQAYPLAFVCFIDAQERGYKSEMLDKMILKTRKRLGLIDTSIKVENPNSAKVASAFSALDVAEAVENAELKPMLDRHAAELKPMLDRHAAELKPMLDRHAAELAPIKTQHDEKRSSLIMDIYDAGSYDDDILS